MLPRSGSKKVSGESHRGARRAGPPEFVTTHTQYREEHGRMEWRSLSHASQNGSAVALQEKHTTHAARL